MNFPPLATAVADAAARQIVINAPGVYDIPEDIYHSDPVPEGSLSSTGARKLLHPSCPAIFKYELDHPPAPTDAMNLGKAAHRLALGAGADIVILIDEDGIPYGDFKKPAARQARDEAIAEGKIPLLEHQYLTVHEMAVALRKHPWASRLLTPGAGKPEQALFWRDGSMWKRCLIDWLRTPIPGHRLRIVEYKTCNKADNDSISNAIYDHGYHQQLEWQLEGIRALKLCDNPEGIFIFQEKKPPYLVNVVDLDYPTQMIGRRRNYEATITYKECMASGVWSGYSDELETVGVPEWVKRQYEGENF